MRTRYRPFPPARFNSKMMLLYAVVVLLVIVVDVFGRVVVVPTTTPAAVPPVPSRDAGGKHVHKPPQEAADEHSKDVWSDVVVPSYADPHALSETSLPIEVATDTWLGTGFFHGLIASFSIIIFTELGDKTFFIAAIMSMTNSRIRVFAGAISALIIMTVLSSLLGFAATVIPHEVTHYAAAALFAVFGFKMLYDAWKMKPEESQEEYNETVIELRERQAEIQRTFGSSHALSAAAQGGASAVPTSPPAEDAPSTSCAETRVAIAQPSTADAPAGALPWKLRVLRLCTSLCSLVFLEALTLTFLAEWGDRSQISTIVLAARGENFWGVNLGACVGHSLCTGLACIGGSLIAKKISPKQVMIAGGLLFLAFAVYGFVAGP